MRAAAATVGLVAALSLSACGGSRPASAPAPARTVTSLLTIDEMPWYLAAAARCVSDAATRDGQTVRAVHPTAYLYPTSRRAPSGGAFVLELAEHAATFAFTADRRQALRLERAVEAAMHRQAAQFPDAWDGVDIPSRVRSAGRVTYWDEALRRDPYARCLR